MTERVTRRDAIGGGLLAAVASMATYAIDKLTAEPSVPRSLLDEAYRSMDKMRVEHSQDLQAQFQQHLIAYEKWLKYGCE